MAHIPIDLYEQYVDEVKDEIFHGLIPYSSSKDINNIKLNDYLYKNRKTRKMSNNEFNYKIALFNDRVSDNNYEVRRLKLINRLRNKLRMRSLYKELNSYYNKNGSRT